MDLGNILNEHNVEVRGRDFNYQGGVDRPRGGRADLVEAPNNEGDINQVRVNAPPVRLRHKAGKVVSATDDSDKQRSSKKRGLDDDEKTLRRLERIAGKISRRGWGGNSYSDGLGVYNDGSHRRHGSRYQRRRYGKTKIFRDTTEDVINIQKSTRPPKRTSIVPNNKNSFKPATNNLQSKKEKKTKRLVIN